MAIGIDLSNVEEAKDFHGPEAGVYVCKICRATNDTEKQYVMAELDIAYGPHKDNAKRIEDKFGQDWGYIRAYFSYKSTALGLLKRNIRRVAESSKVDPIQLEKDFAITDGKCLEGKYIGVVIGQKEYEKNDGTIGKKFGLPELVLAQDAKEHPEKFRIPELKKLKKQEDGPADSAGFGKQTSTSDNDLPF